MDNPRTHQPHHQPGAIRGGKGAFAPGYARSLIGSPTIPGTSGAERTERSHTGLINLILENWLPFTAGFMGRFLPPEKRAYAWESPDDLDGGEHIIRQGDFPSGQRPFPYPWMTGTVSGFCELFDQYSLAWSWGKTPSGPGVATPIPIPWDAQYPTLPKVTG